MHRINEKSGSTQKKKHQGYLVRNCDVTAKNDLPTSRSLQTHHSAFHQSIAELISEPKLTEKSTATISPIVSCTWWQNSVNLTQRSASESVQPTNFDVCKRNKTNDGDENRSKERTLDTLMHSNPVVLHPGKHT